MRTVQGAALDGIKARVRAFAERTGLPLRPARDRPRPHGGPAARARSGRTPGGGTPLTGPGPSLGPEAPGRRPSAGAPQHRASAVPAALLAPAVSSAAVTTVLAALGALLDGTGRPRARRRPDGVRASAAALRALRARHGDAPALVRTRSGTTVLVLLDPRDLRRFYAEPATVLAADPPQRCRGLSTHEPGPDGDGSGCVRGGQRAERRRLNEEVLAAGQPVHPAAGPILTTVADEARHLTTTGTLELVRVRHAVNRAARRIVLGDPAAEDDELAGWLAQLRAEDKRPRGGPRRTTRSAQDRARARIGEYLRHADADTLAGRAARLARPGDPEGAVEPGDEARLWLLAMTAVPETLLRTLLLLGAHPWEQEAAAAEAVAEVAAGPCRGELPRLRACVRESLRLYPVVPDLVRVSREETEWQGVRHPAGTRVLLPAAFHQRDPERVPAAHVFVPGRWKNPGADRDIRMAPFGHGGGRCPGDQLGLMITAAFCAEVLRGHRVTGTRPVLDPVGPLPVTLDPRGIRLALTRR
ncbi:cytochrome P450 [Streptomyces sp. PCS3-D2]|uniref:cytochrome P450 n=1 Tax=Streptomyces sp. PCS3-D2 TaxID=1460244 RepID=UPI00044AF108|nr:cytochrome P450 [Streptomyces sp. PCS3-D2]WKV70291.1 cytochrome P450 [Streptomyces sp. PCS3-D2]